MARRAISATDKGSPTWKERYDETQFSECEWRAVTAGACPYCRKIDSSNVMARWFASNRLSRSPFCHSSTILSSVERNCTG